MVQQKSGGRKRLPPARIVGKQAAARKHAKNDRAALMEPDHTQAEQHARPLQEGGVPGPAAPPTHIVGIGASAGGLEALQHFFDMMPPDTGLAFVVVQHLSPDFRSMMDELLARHTTMRIHRVEDGMHIERDSIYLIPPRKEMFVSNARLLLTDKDPSQAMSLPIDLFLRSLAQDMGDRSVAVILSGTGSDGSRGISRIHDAGGLVMVQSEESANFDGMPRSAIETGVADLVLHPRDMPQALLKFLKHPVQPKPREEEPAQDAPAASEASAEQHQFGKIFAQLMEHYGIDFVYYKPSTVSRRIERRLNMLQIESLDEYAELLRKNRDELDNLYKDLLIGVTQFFRDPKAFDILTQKVVPELVERSARGQDLRLWCPACATGEEVYSLAIMLAEVAREAGKPLNMKIFATDVHRDSLNFAAAGLYHKQSLEKMDKQRIEQYFVKEDDKYRISPDIRRMVVFAEHNVIKDPPFTKVDLISCRNLLIYLQPIVQNKVLSLFHFALRIGGVLFLGPSESLAELQPEFDAVDKHWNIYTKRRDIRLPPQTRFPTGVDLGSRQIGLQNKLTQPQQEGRMGRIFEQLLQTFLPPAILINEHNQLVHMFGDAGSYLRHTAGRFNLDILNMLEGDLRVAMASAIQRAARDLKPVSYKGVRVPDKNGGHHVTLSVTPLLDKSSEAPFMLLQISPEQQHHAQQVDDAGDHFAIDEHAKSRIKDLEQEVLTMRENLQATVEELETSNEELQASNEELLASNEELQSTNEELHSVNEELYTVNAEYEKKIRELSQLTNDMDNLLRSTEIATIFIDRQMQVRKFTPAATTIFNLMPHDEGRPIEHISHNLADIRLLSVIREVLESGQGQERETSSTDGRHLLQRTQPYLDERNEVQGVVITFFDISDIAQAREDLRRAKDAAEKANLAKSEFLAKVSHEIRTPMNAILGMTELALRTHLDSGQREYVQTARDAAQHLLRVVGDILDFSKIEAGALTLVHHDFDLHGLLQRTIKALKLDVESKGLALTMRIASDVPRYLLGDGSRLRQVIENLVGNARKFSDEGEISITVSSQPGRQPQDSRTCLLFAVQDSGMGIPHEQQEHIFDGFFQAQPHLRRNKEGAGLGLAICKQLVTLMGGEIWVESMPDKGSIFSFTACFEPGRKEKIAPDAQTTVEDASFEPLRILLADDNLLNRKTLTAFLEQRGHEVLQAADGEEALDILRATPNVHLAVMDLEMPSLNGLEATRLIRGGDAGAAYRTLPVVAVTAHAMETFRRQAEEAGMDAYVDKPVDMFALHELLLELDARRDGAVYRKRQEDRALSLDVEALLQEQDNTRQDLAELFSLLQKKSREYRAGMREAVDSRDMTAFIEITHRLCSALGAVKARKACELCKELELTAGDQNPRKTRELLARLDREIAAVFGLAAQAGFLDHAPQEQANEN